MATACQPPGECCTDAAGSTGHQCQRTNDQLFLERHHVESNGPLDAFTTVEAATTQGSCTTLFQRFPGSPWSELACIAFKQPLSLPEINGYFSTDKRWVVLRLQHLGLVDCRTSGETGHTVWITTGEFLCRCNLQSPADLERLLLSGELAKAT